MKRVVLIIGLFISACSSATPQTPPTPQVIVVTVVVQPTIAPSTPTQEIPSPTPNPCVRWDQVTSEMAGQTLCVRGLIRTIDASGAQVHWDFSDNRTGFFAISAYLGWHPETGKGMAVGDCVAITGLIQKLQSGRPYIFWGENSIFRAATNGGVSYYEHPDLQVIENNSAFCQQ